MKMIILIGMRGSGKTSVGTLIAQELGLNFFDMDSIIEEDSKTTISSLFNSGQEEIFREMESALLLRLSKKTMGVISTGGGIVLNPNNIKILKHNFTIWLKADVKTLINRTKNSNRPPLTSFNHEEEIFLVKQERDSLYANCSKQFINTTKLSIQGVANKIIELYSAV